MQRRLGLRFSRRLAKANTSASKTRSFSCLPLRPELLTSAESCRSAMTGRERQPADPGPDYVSGLAANSERYVERDRFFTLSLEMLCIAGFDGYFKHLNPAWEKTVGFSNQELMARPYLEFIHPEDRELTLAQTDKLSRGGQTVVFENRFRCKGGQYR